MNRTTFFIASVTSLVLGVVMGCPPAPAPTPPIQDAGDASDNADARRHTDPCADACANLAIIGCREASDGTNRCESTCRHVLETKIIKFDAACLAKVTTKLGARTCGLECK